ncbi:caspase family protein [Roseomonas sp. NAR14]|uniref:Caspase family protein n=1 Tax=Roseomonas acroporae TaxID=2937791 RepID=A0A9X2BT26_9PROT|nr:caspase family protein [Roseomonas acroporae]MCK8782846.1 caspase family protein [Roseomonas acroporae]
MRGAAASHLAARLALVLALVSAPSLPGGEAGAQPAGRRGVAPGNPYQTAPQATQPGASQPGPQSAPAAAGTAPAAAPPRLADAPAQPFLRLEAGAHTAAVSRLATDASGHLLASASADKTVRLWSLPDGAPRGVLRPPIGPGVEGELYAVALSPDGATAYAAGFTGQSWDGTFAIYRFDTATGRLTARFTGLPAPVEHLAVSPDGSRLAAGLKGRAGLRVWNTADGAPVFDDAGYGGPVRMVAFDPAGRLVTSSADGRVRLYGPDGRRLAERAPLPGAIPYGIAFSPDGALVALGYENRLRVEILSATDLRTVLVPDPGRLQGEGFPGVAWAADGRGGVQLYAAGYARTGPGAFVVRRWTDFGLGAGSDVVAARDSIAHLLPLPGGGVAYAALDPGWGRIAGDGTVALAPASPAADFRNTGLALAVSPDGLRVRFALRADAPPLVFDAASRQLGTEAGAPPTPPQAAGTPAAPPPGAPPVAVPAGPRPLSPGPISPAPISPGPPAALPAGAGDKDSGGRRGVVVTGGERGVVVPEAGQAPAARPGAGLPGLAGNASAPPGPALLAPNFAGPFVPARTESPRLPLSGWRDTNRPRLGNAPLMLGEGEFSRSAALLPGGGGGDAGVLLGTDTHLRLFDAAGRPVDALLAPAPALGVTVVGTVAVAAFADGTIRWYDLPLDPAGAPQPGAGGLRERAALFVHADGRRWVVWTPEGLFDHAAEGGQDLVGFHLNAGRSRTPEWASFAQAYRPLYTPAAVQARLRGDAGPAQQRMAELGDVRGRIGRQPVLARRRLCAVRGDTCTALRWNAAALPEGATALRLTFAAQDRGLGTGPVDVLVNDRLAARAETPAQGGEVTVEVPLDPGPNRLATRLYAGDRALFAQGPALDLRRPEDYDAPVSAGRLLVLAVGVDTYANPQLNLRYAVADARTVSDTLRAAAQGLYREVKVTTLTDGQATRQGVLDALAAIAAEAQPEDTFVLYVGGHGVLTDTDHRFLFLGSDVRDTSSFAVLRQQALDEGALVAALARIRARDGFLFVDTCHSGQITVDSLAAVGNETGRFMLAASTSAQEALDSYDDRNGVFAYAVREALSGRAAMDADRRVSALSLGEYVMRRVPQLAAQRQHRQDAVFRTAARDLRSFPLGQVPPR